MYASELKCFRSFCDTFGVAPLPASEGTVKRFVAIFRDPSSAEKYLTAIRWAHDFAGLKINFDSRSLKQVLRGAFKLKGPPAQVRAILWPLLRRLVRHASSRGQCEQSCAYVLAANFLFRVPSELIPLRFDNVDVHSSVKEFVEDGRPVLEISLKSRKNRPRGSVLRRACRCPGDQLLCPVHALRALLAAQGRSRRVGKVFSLNITGFTRKLREHLSALEVDDPAAYASHSFRRGSAQQLLKDGGRLAHILRAGEWRSASFLDYQDKELIDQAAVLDLIIEADSGDESD